MRVMVTGCCGHIGSWLTEAFIERGDHVLGIDNLSGGELRHLPRSPKARDAFAFFQVDLGSYPAVEEVFAAHRPEIVYHCAAQAREGASFFSPHDCIRSNIFLSSIVVELGIKYGMQKLVFLSSMARFGSQKAPFSEKMPRKAVDIYGTAKIATEEMIEQLAAVHNFRATILAPHNVFGPRQSLRDVFRNCVAIFMQRVMRHEPLYLYGSEHVRSFSYIEDCLPALVRAADLDTANGEVISVGGKEPITIRTMAEEVIKNFPEYPTPEIIELPPRYGEVKVAYATYAKSVELLGYEETLGWAEGVRRMAAWAKQVGPQEWRADRLAIPTAAIPLPWQEHQARARL